MKNTGFKEISETKNHRFESSSLGKLSEGKKLDTKSDKYDRPLNDNVDRYKNCPIDGRGGHWDGQRGNSNFIPEKSHVPKERNPEHPYSNPYNQNMGQIMKKYDLDRVPFKGGDMDLSKVSKGTVKIEGFSERRSDNFDKADRELAAKKHCSPEEVRQWRKENNYTWHERQDMETMQLVPNEIHANIPHSGGISEIKKGA